MLEGMVRRVLLSLALFLSAGVLAFMYFSADTNPVESKPFQVSIPTSSPKKVNPPSDFVMEDNSIYIPSLGVSAPLVGLEKTPSLELPTDPAVLGVYLPGATTTSQNGVMLITGHVSWSGKRGALFELSKLEPESEIYVKRGGVTTKFLATSRENRDKGGRFPDLYDTSGPLRLALVTCGGIPVNGSYPNNVIVWAYPV